MRISDEILAELKKGTSLSEIRKKYRSQSQLYEALDIFLFEADGMVQERNITLQSVIGELSERKAELESVKAAKENFQRS